MTTSEFVETLQRNGLQMVVDVRSAPYSQYAPHFNREAVSKALADAKIGYVYAGEYLGGRPQDPTCYAGGKVPADKADYRKLVDYAQVARRPWYRKGIDRLVQIAAERPTVIMCTEEDPRQCHRYHLITSTLHERGISVVHLRSKEEVEQLDSKQPQQLSMF